MSDARALWDAAAESMAPEVRQALQLKGVQEIGRASCRERV